MIRVDPEAVLSPEEDYGLATLIDLARLLALEAGARAEGEDIVRVTVTPSPTADRVGEPSDLARGQWAFAVRDGEVGIPRHLLARVTALAGAGAEQRSSARDRHGRVPSSENPLVAAGDFRDPVVSRCAAALRAAVVQAAAGRPVWVLDPWPDGKRWCVAMTHDLDVVAWWPLATGLRIAELLAGGHPLRAAHVVGSAVLGTLATVLDDAPVRHGVQGVLAVEASLGLRSTWFVLAGTPGVASLRAGDITYRPESRAARRILASVWSSGHEIGLHGSFATAEDGSVFAVQRSRLRAVSEGDPAGVRQHFLKMRPGLTQRGMAAAGFAYDATYGFPDRNGFRLGVADVVPAWDDRLRQTTSLDEIPLMWMDRAQSKYQGIEDPEHWVEDALETARACESVEGLWVGLWHPNLTPALGYPGAPPAYRRLLMALMARDPYVATLDRIVAWRRLRRSVRAKGITPDGGVVLTKPRSGASADVFRVSVRLLSPTTPP